jgi:hypothetical protein
MDLLLARALVLSAARVSEPDCLREARDARTAVPRERPKSEFYHYRFSEGGPGSADLCNYSKG